MKKKLDKILKNTELNGRKLLDDELPKLRSLFDINILSETLVELLKKYEIISQKFSMPEDIDPSQMGVEMEWMTPNEQLDEAQNYQPGKSALLEFFIPIGKCLEGSGDPYFLKENERELKIYRIPHDAINGDKLEIEEVEYICLLTELFQFTKH